MKVILVCHDDKAQTYDELDVDMMNEGYDYLDCITDYSDLEMYEDVDIVELSTKLTSQYSIIKPLINEIIREKQYEIAYKMDGFCFYIEECLK